MCDETSSFRQCYSCNYKTQNGQSVGSDADDVDCKVINYWTDCVIIHSRVKIKNMAVRAVLFLKAI